MNKAIVAGLGFVAVVAMAAPAAAECGPSWHSARSVHRAVSYRVHRHHVAHYRYAFVRHVHYARLPREGYGGGFYGAGYGAGGCNCQPNDGLLGGGGFFSGLFGGGGDGWGHRGWEHSERHGR